ncbi:hypothetical protein AVI51_15095 [Piscirickettsia salmonis]|uniref:Small T antigen n=1 Tax=Piscirickettsia salmonis TaxID=1238 RepID=A0A9Q5V8S9_PISSA|nr:DnaJ domain-containing protein [Piscirickettsia salmonis]ALA24357.1 molecular chaperone DnaJ [Piscirickettsia salmonis]APS44729.1 hypothetical protein AVI48_10380 [Piscirickettsia salmonis]APS48089.1 hypothetical protein AVI49_10985 [Piscirickettsia salmonis]APS52045.1 hypothetical protein AVI50_15250 [Piscirickettsia salmonis]APS55263.1 hypothetical protein AVI51_15095 [Piscirickettsia salmonis]
MEKVTIKQALKIFALTQGCYTAQEIKTTYKRLTLKYHPDRGGEKEVMQAILKAWEILKELQEVNIDDFFGKAELCDDYNDDAMIEKIRAAIVPLKDIKTPDVEVCGIWLYLHTDLRGEEMKKIRESLKEFGWAWGNKKKCWYYNPEPSRVKRSARRTGWGLDKIRGTYGSSKYKGNAGPNHRIGG